MFWATGLLPWSARVRAFLPARLVQASNLFSQRLPLPSDQYGIKFVFAVGSVLVFTLLAYWSLTDFYDVKWYAGEDGVSEWWSVVTYLASAVMAIVTARVLAQLGHPHLGLFHLLFAVLFLVAMMEEMSWGQRLFGWSTPETLTRVNEQGETTLHNIKGLDSIAATTFFWGGFLALAGAAARAVLHHHRRVTTADFILPSLIVSPALIMIIFSITAGQSVPSNIPLILLTYFDLDPEGSEIPEVLAGLCLVLYTYGNFRRAAMLRAVDSPRVSPIKAAS